MLTNLHEKGTTVNFFVDCETLKAIHQIYRCTGVLWMFLKMHSEYSGEIMFLESPVMHRILRRLFGH